MGNLFGKDYETRDDENARQAEVEETKGEPEQHGGYVPTEADYERARNEGIADEPELPAGVVRKDAR